VRKISAILISGVLILFSACSKTEHLTSDDTNTCPVCLGSGFMRQYISHDSESSSTTYHGGDGVTTCSGNKRIY